jgi:integrase/recombinase XerD
MNWPILVEAYLTSKRQLGFELYREERDLQHFARFAMKQSDNTTLSLDLALRWANLTTSDEATTVAKRFSTLRPFSRYLAMQGYDATVLPTRFLGPPQKRLPPYVFSHAEIDELMQAALELCPKNGLRAVTMATFIGLIVSTGLRPGEAVRLQREDVELDLGEMVIHNSKGWQHRLVPLSSSTVDVLRAYVINRDKVNSSGQISSFFQLDNNRELNMRSAEHAFGYLRKKVGLSIKFNGRYPRLYDLRHTFVCQRVINWYQSGDDVNCHIAQLSRYIGHKNVSDTYWYLTAIPALMACAAVRFSKMQPSGELS